MTKDIATGIDEEQKRYLAIRGLRKPFKLYNVVFDDMFEDEQIQLILRKNLIVSMLEK